MTTTNFNDLTAEQKEEFFAAMDILFAGDFKYYVPDRHPEDTHVTLKYSLSVSGGEELRTIEKYEFTWGSNDDATNSDNFRWLPTDAAAERIAELVEKHNVTAEIDDDGNDIIYSQLVSAYAWGKRTEVYATLADLSRRELAGD